MKKYFCVSDVHGFYDFLIKALTDAGFDKENENHIFVSCGDLMDRGSKSVECLKFVNSLDRKILIRGNHEDLIVSLLDRQFPLSHDYSNGTYDTVLQLAKYNNELNISNISELYNMASNNIEYINYISNTINYYETSNYIFTHAWIPCIRSDPNMYHAKNVKYTYDPNWRNSTTEQWETARWPNGMDCWNQGVIEPNKTIVCGHWHCSWGNHYLHNDGVEFPNKYSTNKEHRTANFNPFVDNGICAIDACTAISNKINCVILEDD